MPVTTRRKVQTPIPFKCRKTRNSKKCSPADDKKLNEISKYITDDEGECVKVLRSPEKRSSMSVNISSKNLEPHRSVLNKEELMSSSYKHTPSSSPRKRNLLQEMSTNDERPPMLHCSPRKMKKENIPIAEPIPCNTSPLKLSPSVVQPSGLICEVALKALTPAQLHQIRTSPEKKLVCKMSSSPLTPRSKSRENVVRESVCLTPPSVKRSPKKAVRSLKLERTEGEGYKRAKQALHTALPDRLLCRDKEIQTMTSFLKSHLARQHAGSLYISGAPGTGKTACLSQVLRRQQKLTSKALVIFVNCMSVRQSQGIYGKILGEVCGASSHGKLSAKDASRKLQKTFTSPGPMVVLVLDEIDHLDSKGQEVLYTMFEWPSLPKSRLILIGVANALDLTDRILPRLQARPKCKPELLHFSPYSKDQIATILLDRVQNNCDEDSVVEPIAVQLCARKVAAVAGDMRKALDVCRRAVEIVECDVKSQLWLGCRSPASSSPLRLRKVGIKQVSSVIAEVYGSRLATTSSQSQTFPLQQKIMICTVLLMVRGGRLKEVTLGKCHESYSRLCKDRHLPAVEQSEFLSLCQLVESRGLIGLKYSKDTRQTKISLKLNEREVEAALQDKVLLSSILQGDALSKKKK